MLGYKHTKQAIEKMKLRFANKSNHPMFGKKHSESVLSLISKPSPWPQPGTRVRAAKIKSYVW